MDVHELTAGYALDALDPAERATFEEHLSSCERCREELQGFWQVSGALAHAAGGPTPPASLREPDPRAGAQRALERRPAAAAPLPRARALLGRGGGGGRRDRARHLGDVALARPRRSRERAGRARATRTRARSESESGKADLVVTPSGDAALVVRTLAPAPEGKDYEIWVFENGVPRRAGLFEQPGVALLTRQVEPGQMVAVTLEPDGGVDAPTGAPLFTASSA